MDNWYRDVMKRPPSSPLPPLLRDAIRTIEWCRTTLLAEGYMQPLSEYYPDPANYGGAPGGMPRSYAQTMPPCWNVIPPLSNLGLEVVDDNGEWAARVAQAQQEWQRACAIRATASKAYELIAPLFWATEALQRELYLASESGVPFVSMQVVQALVRVRNILAYSNKPPITEWVARFGAGLDQTRDLLRGHLIRAYLRGQLTDDLARELVAALEAEVEQGQWADPEGDIERLAAEVA